MPKRRDVNFWTHRIDENARMGRGSIYAPFGKCYFVLYNAQYGRLRGTDFGRTQKEEQQYLGISSIQKVVETAYVP